MDGLLMEKPIKMEDLRVPLFSETPMSHPKNPSEFSDLQILCKTPREGLMWNLFYAWVPWGGTALVVVLMGGPGACVDDTHKNTHVCLQSIWD